MIGGADVCMDTSRFTLFILLCIGLVCFALYITYTSQEKYTNELNELRNKECPVCPSIQNSQPPMMTGQFQSSMPSMPSLNSINALPVNIPPMIPRDPMFRIETLPWTAPVRPNMWDSSISSTVFAQVGYVTKMGSNNPEKRMMPLYGRRAYAYQFEYYVINPKNGIKIPINNRNGNELYSGDEIKIDDHKGLYRITLYDSI